jgi:uncharacterized membrane protein
MHLTILLIVLIATTSLVGIAQATATPEGLTLTVYFDGAVLVDYIVRLDPESPAANVTLFGQVWESILVIDERELPLDYAVLLGEITVFSLGAEEATVTYLTQDLTTKNGRFWTVNITAPINTTVILPTKAAIISLNRVPELIEGDEDHIVLIMPAGLVEVTYVIGVLGTKEHAQIVITAAEHTITDIGNLNVTVTHAEAKLQDAKDAFNGGDYVQAEMLGYEAEDLAVQTNNTATLARTRIDEGETAIINADNEGRTTGLPAAQALLNQANSAYAVGDYEQALTLATEAKNRADEATTPLPYYVGLVALVVALAVGVLVYRFRIRPKAGDETKPRRRIDVAQILHRHDLRPEEKAAIQFLGEHDGESFESELYKTLELPRTTTWRMLRRLETMGIVKITKYRKQNYVRVKKRYEIKK